MYTSKVDDLEALSRLSFLFSLQMNQSLVELAKNCFLNHSSHLPIVLSMVILTSPEAMKALLSCNLIAISCNCKVDDLMKKTINDELNDDI
jgi:hypothetical protein